MLDLVLARHRGKGAKTVAGPFIFIGTHTFKEGKLEDFKRDSRALAELVREKEPRLLSFAFTSTRMKQRRASSKFTRTPIRW